ncbi:DMT family transporter [Gammaproteobacteria bacterium AS21]
MEKQNKAVLLGLAAVLLWSTVATAFSISLSYLTPAQLLTVCAITSFICLISLVAYKGQMKELVVTAKTSYKSSLLFGAINPFIYYLVLLEAYRLLPAQEAQSINYTWAIMLSFMAIPILKQKLLLADIIAAILCYFGVLVIATQGQLASLSFSNLTGVLFALLSTVIWALYWLLNTKDSRPSLIGLTLNFAFSLPLIIGYYFLTSTDALWPSEGIMGAIYIGLFEMGITFVLWNTALKLTDKATKIANLIFLSPILSIVWLSQLTDEVIQLSTLIGLSFILFGLITQNWIKKKNR